ncbi:MAG: hypothetical protein IJH41_02925 [Eubacterium sp.]|nr:hypothetical protein [Eubacterium sp.]
MSNWLLFVLLTIVVLVNVYFTYRRAEGVDDTGRKLLAASQLLYLVFIVFIFGLGKILGMMGIANGLQSGGASMPVFIGSIVVVGVILFVFLFLKKKLENKIRQDHAA